MHSPTQQSNYKHHRDSVMCSQIPTHGSLPAEHRFPPWLACQSFTHFSFMLRHLFAFVRGHQPCRAIKSFSSKQLVVFAHCFCQNGIPLLKEQKLYPSQTPWPLRLLTITKERERENPTYLPSSCVGSKRPRVNIPTASFLGTSLLF